MRWDKYIQAFNLIQAGHPSPTITDRRVLEHNQWHQVFQFTFDDGAILHFEHETPIPGQPFAGPIPKPFFQIIKPPDDNVDNFQIGDMHVLITKQSNDN
jgi:hypothetical protein